MAVTEVADYTGFPEMLDGRVKTLHPKVHGGILARRDLPEHVATLAQHGIPTIDLVVVNLYPFQQTVAKDQCTLEDAIENIDIGGPTMLRSAAKNHKDVVVLYDPADYGRVLAEMQANNGEVGYDTKFDLAKKVFAHTAHYDGAITNYLTALGPERQHATKSAYPQTLNLQFEKVQDMRYGENPHQSAAFYRDLAPAAGALANYTQLQGKELSYNNIGDADAAWECVKTFRYRQRGLRHRQARQPVRRRDRRRSAGSLQQGLADRPDLGLRRHHRLQPRTGRQGGRSGGQAVRRSADRAGVHRRSQASVRRQAERAPAGNSARRWRAMPSTSSASAAACCCSRRMRRTSPPPN